MRDVEPVEVEPRVDEPASYDDDSPRPHFLRERNGGPLFGIMCCCLIIPAIIALLFALFVFAVVMFAHYLSPEPAPGTETC